MLAYVGFTAYSFVFAMLALLVDLVAYKVWAFLSWADLIFLEEVDIGLRTRTLVFGVMYKLDLGEFASHDCFYGCFESRADRKLDGLC